MKYRDLHPLSSIGRYDIVVLADEMYTTVITTINCLDSPQGRLTTKVPPVMSRFWIFEKRDDPVKPES